MDAQQFLIGKKKKIPALTIYILDVRILTESVTTEEVTFSKKIRRVTKNLM